MGQIAHVRLSDDEEQSIEEHLTAVQEIAEQYGKKLNVKYLAGLAGMLHDLGKYSDDFQHYIKEALVNPEAPPKRGSVDHSTAGGKMLYELFHQKGKTNQERLLAEIIGNIIISHHSYLQDYLNHMLKSTYLKRVKEKEISQYSDVKEAFFSKVMNKKDFESYVKKAIDELKLFLQKTTPDSINEDIMFLSKFLFSTLIDADRTDSMLFEEGKSYQRLENRQSLFSMYYGKLMEQLKIYEERVTEENKIGTLRKEMSEQCEKFASKPSGVYSLSIPTGGGKTLASLRYALQHALQYEKERIIYVVPYTTIIEQNAEEVRRILDDKVNILEYHSNVIENKAESDADDNFFQNDYKVKLSKETWDSSIIFTTMVQFLNVFYESGTRSIRRLHNLTNSVIIFDEVQKVPTACVALFNKAVNFLKNHGNSTALLCTATQPSLDYVENKLEINTDGEIIKDLTEVVDAFKRVELFDYASQTSFNAEELSNFVQHKIIEQNSVLIVLNTRKVVRDLFDSLNSSIDEDIHLYHLSTTMCAAHRKNLIADMKEKLEKNKKVICVSTQLIEAGVDISFKCVIRSLAGLDSIAQAAGRCNRHGECETYGEVYIINHENESLNQLKEIKAGKIIAKKILIDINRNEKANVNDILSVEVMERYFQEFYSEFKLDLDYPITGFRENMVEMLTDGKKESARYQSYLNKYKQHIGLMNISSMHTAAMNFQVIENNTTSVIAPYQGGEEIISKLISAETITNLNHLLKEAQQYIVNVYDNEKRLLSEADGIYGIFDNQIFILGESFYDEKYGISYNADAQLDNLMF